MENNLPWMMAGMLGAALILGGLLFTTRIRKTGGSVADALIPFLIGIPMAALGGKLLYMTHNLGMDFRSWDAERLIRWDWEEISFVGCCAGFVFGIWIGAKIRRRETGETLDAFALPGCVMVCLARIGEYGIDSIGRGPFIEGGILSVFPFSVKDSWGDSCLAVFMMEAMTAAAVGIWILLRERKRGDFRGSFQRAVIALCAGQLFWEMLLTSWIPCVISFIHYEQVLCAIIAMWIIIRQCVREKRVWPAIAAAGCLILNGVTQYVQDKPYQFDWLLPAGTPVSTVARICFALSAIGMMAAGIRSLQKRQEC